MQLNTTALKWNQSHDMGDAASFNSDSLYQLSFHPYFFFFFFDKE